MKIAMLSPIAWRTPPRDYGPWESVVSLLAEGLVQRGLDVTLFATKDSQTRGRLVGVSPRGYEEDKELLPKVWECLHISELFEQGDEFDLIHNHFDYLPLTYTGMTTTPVITTIHGFSSPKILPVYKKYNGRAYYVAISEADKSPELDYIATIHHGIDLNQFTFQSDPGDYLLFFGRIHHEKGTKECIETAKEIGMRIILAGIVQDEKYFEQQVKPHLDDDRIVYVGTAGPEKRNELLGGAYALLHPINFDEPFGLSVIEAMACGTPVIAVNRGSMPEIISDGTTGFLVADAAEMRRAVTKIKDIDRRKCRKWVEERFSVDRMVDDYLRVYEKILKQTKREDHRPWGFYEILSDKSDYKAKRITVYPGQRLSYQRHFRRAEHWYVVCGNAVVTKNDQDVELAAGQAIDLPVETWHRVRNPGNKNLVFIEVQTGDYFGEDDIERSDDDYGRV
ncbi:MAG: glycosyltransferase [Deltaproteobacteria bacterium]|nr:glycosyltransferase [Deltaproteobacteria bacterium]